ncbi:MAG: galactokinase [Candidatus Omnitrophica bacterium]|nr:galactokinase [Candidatus Omnitrophota bacterium]
MIITQTPFRITLGGGGTDLPAFYSKHGGFLVTSAINKYVYITINRRTIDDTIWLSYSKIEKRKKVDSIKHELIREALKMTGIKNGIEIHSVTELSSGTGLGSSGSFTVGLLNALHTFKREYAPHAQLAEEASGIEIGTLGKPVGKQDQYIAAFGGIISLEIDRKGAVTVKPLNIQEAVIEELERRVMLFYTGVTRESAYVLADQTKACERDDKKVVANMRRIKEIGLLSKKALEDGDLDGFGALLHEHWEVKKGISNKVSFTKADELYESARKKGALGGKVIGAGGGGFLMVFSGDNPAGLRESLKTMGLKEMRFRFDFGGTKVIANFF